MRRKICIGEKPYAFAISKSNGSVSRTAVVKFAQTIGKTIKNEMNTGTCALVIHTSAKIMKDTTGVVFMTVSIGLNSVYKAFDAHVSTASTAPANTPKKYPFIMPNRDETVFTQKSAVTTNSAIRFATESGEAIKTSFPTA